MGLLTGLLTLPLAPVRGTIWIAERIAEQAERELDDEAVLRRRLGELQTRYELGEIDEAEYDEAEEVLFTRLEQAREDGAR